jgi:hypothetical protein
MVLKYEYVKTKKCGVSIVLNNGIIQRYPKDQIHPEIDESFETSI